MVRPRKVWARSLADFGLDRTISGVALDSRQVQPGDLFVAVAGRNAHGIRFATRAEAAGAVAILTDRLGASQNPSKLPVIAVDQPRVHLGPIASDIYGHPAQRAISLGVTGTNGKTSTVFLIESALAELNHRVGTIGTIGFRVGGQEIATDRTTITTPEAPDLQALMAVMIEDEATALALEVSSHALVTDRVNGITFDTVGFTMFGHDHLDFHQTVEAYFEAKTRLFTPQMARRAVVAIDDAGGREIAGLARAAGLETVTTSVRGPADFWLLAQETRRDGTNRVVFGVPSGEVALDIAMMGHFNVANALTALAMTAPFGDLESLAAGLATAQVPGRMQRVLLPTSGVAQTWAPQVVVDFAHTPEAVAAALSSVKFGRKIAVLGCGGDRDPVKRGPMGVSAAEHADIVIITDDNPRSEDPKAIRQQVLAGARSVSSAQVIDGQDRANAIALALDLAQPEDWVMILGKGHERGQEIAGAIIPFDDVTEVRRAWGRRVSDA